MTGKFKRSSTTSSVEKLCSGPEIYQEMAGEKNVNKQISPLVIRYNANKKSMNAATAIMIEYVIRLYGIGRRTILVEEGESLTKGHDGISY